MFYFRTQYQRASLKKQSSNVTVKASQGVHSVVSIMRSLSVRTVMSTPILGAEKFALKPRVAYHESLNSHNEPRRPVRSYRRRLPVTRDETSKCVQGGPVIFATAVSPKGNFNVCRKLATTSLSVPMQGELLSSSCDDTSWEKKSERSTLNGSVRSILWSLSDN